VTISRLSSRILDAGLVLLIAVVAVAALAFPAGWLGDIQPAPDAGEYAVTAQRLAAGASFALPWPGGEYPSRYPFGFSALLAPAYWLPGATVRSGLYAVMALAAVAIVLVYLLGRRLLGRPGGLIAALTLLLLPPYLGWSRAIMSETATVALVAAAAFLLHAACASMTTRRRDLLLFGAGLGAGVALLVRLNNVALFGALVAGGLVGIGPRRITPRAALALAVGPACALLALALYNARTFGGPLATGYRYWVPEWYSQFGTTFSLAYAFRTPPLVGDLNAPAGLSNLAYYARSLTGTLPARGSLLLTSGLAALAALGTLAALPTRDRPARAVVVFGLALAALTCAVYVPYFLADVRFLAPLAPLAALAVGNAGRLGLACVRDSLRARRPLVALPRATLGAVILAVLLQNLFPAAAAARDDSYFYRRFVRGDAAALQRAAPALDTVAAYRAIATPGSILVTDLLPPLLGASGFGKGYQVVPLTRGEYWGQAPLRDTTPVTDRQRLLLTALRAGTPVYLDEYSLAPIRRQGSGDIERFLAAHNARLETVDTDADYPDGSVTLYRMLPIP
jgi:4-amino-4-deoxy-L-arabinose transferase-like glycosyltransferase